MIDKKNKYVNIFVFDKIVLFKLNIYMQLVRL